MYTLKPQREAEETERRKQIEKQSESERQNETERHNLAQEVKVLLTLTRTE